MNLRLIFFSFASVIPFISKAQENFVRTEEFLEATRDANAPVRKRVTTVYYDGLGRERWRVVEGAHGASPVTARTDYDGRGNVWRQWLPVPGDVRTDMGYRDKADAMYGSFQRPYTQISYEESGRNRPVYNQGPGSHWQGKGVKTEYHRCALSGDYACRALLADCESGKVTIKNIYAPGTLAVTEVTDEDGMRTLLFRNLDNNVILERRIDTAGRKADTRFIYDQRKDLRYIISPEGVSRIGESGTVDDFVLKNYAQAFEYDFLHKMTSSRLPGCGKTEYVYDKLDRVVLTADSVQRSKHEWTVTKYDDNWKPAIRGTAKIPGVSRESLQDLYSDSIFEEHFKADFNRMEYALQYTNDCGPAGFEPYEAWYYNNYDFMVGRAAGKRTFFETPHDKGATYTAVGMCTGRAFIDTAGNTFYRAMKYDGYDNLVATMEWDCYMNQERYSTNSEFNFTRQPLSVTETYETMAEGSVTSKRTATRTYTYDDWGRVATETLSVDGAPAVTVCENSYDEIGRLVARTLGAAQVSYEYDIRQHTTGIVAEAYTERASYTEGPDNEPRSYRFVNATTDSWRDCSNITLGYAYDGFGHMKEAVSTDGTLAESLTSNLDATVTDVVRRYNNAVVQDAHIDIDGALPTGVRDESSPHYQDAVGRFAPGTYTMTYDGNGRLTADGTRGVTSVSYHPWLNLPQTIKFDSGDWAKSDYWPDGTLRSRFTQTRRIDPISVVKNSELYPIGVIPDSTATIDPAAIVNPTLRTTRLYRGSFEIVNGSESYARVNTSTGYYDCKEKRHYYYLANRQGSVMAVIDDQGATVQRTGLYPSGTPFVLPSDINPTPTKNTNSIFTPAASTTPALTPATDRLHIGNRWLAHSGLNRYDNTARLHDPLLCRFDTPDPLASKFPGINPWTHTAANPANAIDPDGCKFTSASMPYIVGYIDDISNRIDDIYDDIENLNNKLANGKISQKKYESKINNHRNNHQKLIDIITEISTLISSDQVYNIQISNKYNKSATAEGSGGAINSVTTYNPENGEVDIILGDRSMGMLSHELKHAYQFETGNISFGNANPKITFYDQTDEIEAYGRSSIFGLNRPRDFYHIYQNNGTEANGILCLPNEILKTAGELEKYSQRFKIIFRYNNKTYRP